MSDKCYYDLGYVTLDSTGRLKARFVVKGVPPHNNWPKQFELDMLLVSCLLCRNSRRRSRMLFNDRSRRESLYQYRSTDSIWLSAREVHQLISALIQKSANASIVPPADIHKLLENINNQPVNCQENPLERELVGYDDERVACADVTAIIAKYTNHGLPQWDGSNDDPLTRPDWSSCLEGLSRAQSHAGVDPILRAYNAGFAYVRSLRARESTPIFAYAP